MLKELDERKEVLCTYYDVSKAFDKVSHQALMGISGEFMGRKLFVGKRATGSLERSCSILEGY
jgi:ethanolamine transporter EutH